jgi:hypothetical protein
MEERSLHHLTQLLNLLLAATNIAVRHVRLLLNLYGHLQAQAVVEKSKIHNKSLLLCRVSALKHTVRFIRMKKLRMLDRNSCIFARKSAD